MATAGTGDAGDSPGPRRGMVARAGVVALNLIFPGLGLSRLGRWRAAAAAGLALLAILLLTAFGMGRWPITSQPQAVAALIAVLAAYAMLLMLSMAATWRASRFATTTTPLSRWYGIVLVTFVALAVSQAALAAARNVYRPFRMPSESMSPTIDIGDSFVADMRWRGPLRRGDVILFDRPGGIWVSRIAALPGDRIAMRGGVPIVNGVAARYLPGVRPAERIERLPGETTRHLIADIEPTPRDDMAETIVPAGHAFVLGDNRGRSADSRVPAAEGGVGPVPLAAIVGRPVYIHWSDDRDRIGTRLDR